jgi:hypothetical protein
MEEHEITSPIDPCLQPFLDAKAEEEELYLTQLLEQVKPDIKKIICKSKNPEDAFQKWAQRVIKSLRDCKADPVGRAIKKYQHYVTVVASHVIQEEFRQRSPVFVPISVEDSEDERPQSEPLQTSELQTFEEAEVQEFFRHLWAGIERLSSPHRIAYLLNFTDANGWLDVFMAYGANSIRRIGATMRLTDEQFAWLWRELLPDDEARRRAESLTNYYEKFALLWQYWPLEDQVIARMLNKERQQVISLRAKARKKLAKGLAAWRRRT